MTQGNKAGNRPAIEDVLFTSVGSTINFCVMCADDRVAEAVMTEISSGSCVHSWKICNECVYADLRLEGVLQVPGYLESFVSLFRRYKTLALIFMGDDDPQEFNPDDLLVAA